MSDLANIYQSNPQKLENIELTGPNPLEDPNFQDFISQKQAELGTKGRIFIRKSGTQNLIRVLVEHESEVELEKRMSEILQRIK